MANPGKRRKREHLDSIASLLHTGGISMAGLRSVMKKVKDADVDLDVASSKRALHEANSERLCVM